MALTLPSEIQTEKNKVHNEPMVFGRFMTGLNSHFGSASYRLDDVESGTDGVISVSGGSGTFTSASATFQTWGVRAGDIIHITSPFTDDYTITSVASETVVNVTGTNASTSGCGWELDMWFDEIIPSKMPLAIRQNINELVNSSLSRGGLTFDLLGWRASLRADIVGSSPDLSSHQIKAYLKYRTSASRNDGHLAFYTGAIEEYFVQRDILSLRLKPVQLTDKIPLTLLTDFYTLVGVEHDADEAMPLQIGDLDSSVIANRDYSDTPRQWAKCPLVYYNSLTFKWCVAGHELHSTFGSGVGETDWTPYLSTYNTANYYSAFMRDGVYVFFSPYHVPNATWTNNSNENVIQHLTTSTTYALIRLPPDETANANTAQNPENAYDKDASTTATVSNVYTKLALKCNRYGEMSSSSLMGFTGGDGLLEVRAGIITGGTFQIYAKDPTGTTTTAILASNTTTTLQFSPGSVTEIKDWEFGVQHVSGTGSAPIKEVIIQAYVNKATKNDKYLYLAGLKGRRYSGTWGGRKTSGNAIVNPSDAIESILRDDLGYENIDTDSFDDATTNYGGVATTTCAVALSLTKQILFKDFIEEWNKAFNCSVINASGDHWRYIVPRASAVNFSQSGTGTPGNEDIFTDSAAPSGGSYSQHPILLNSFKLRRTSLNEIYEGIVLEAYQDLTKTYTQGEGGGKVLSASNRFINSYNGNAANTLLGQWDDWFFFQKWICEFETFWNAIGVEPGDVINIRHNDLNDDILDATVNTQKWLVIETDIRWRPNKIKITAIELL